MRKLTKQHKEDKKTAFKTNAVCQNVLLKHQQQSKEQWTINYMYVLEKKYS